MFKWMRLPAADAAGTNTNDTTEVQIGTGLTVPEWAQSIKYIHYHIVALALTTKQSIAGYIRLANDKNTLDPLNFPLPLVTVLTGAIGTHIVEDQITAYCEHEVEKNDTIRAYAGLDELSTGVHTIQAYIGFSSESAKVNMKAQKSAVIAGSATANTAAGAATISTIAGRSKEIVGCWNYLYAYPTVDQTCGGYINIESAASGWQKQEIPTNMIPSGLSTQITPLTKPIMSVPEDWLAKYSGFSMIPWMNRFPCTTKQDFNFKNFMDGTNTVAPAGRYGLIWLE